MKECQRPHPFERKWPESFGNEGVEASRSLGKDEVPSSNLGSSSTKNPVTAMVTGFSFVGGPFGPVIAGLLVTVWLIAPPGRLPISGETNLPCAEHSQRGHPTDASFLHFAARLGQ